VKLSLVLPKGSLERATFDLFAAADLAVVRSSEVDYRARIDDDRIGEVRILRPQEIPRYVASGLFDIGITGRDWIEETGAEVVSLGELGYSKATAQPIRLVLAVASGSSVESVEDLPAGCRVATEYPELTRRYLASRGVNADVQLSYGATEAKVPEIADAVVEITETGRALRAAGLRIVDTVLESRTELIANPVSASDPDKRRSMDQVLTLLEGALEARGKVLVKLNVSADRLEHVLDMLPSMRSPTVSELYGGQGYAVETVVPKDQINVLIPELSERGATDILEIPLSKIVH
jgi:ATP phosphoribosyltransferase